MFVSKTLLVSLWIYSDLFGSNVINAMKIQEDEQRIGYGIETSQHTGTGRPHHEDKSGERCRDLKEGNSCERVAIERSSNHVVFTNKDDTIYRDDTIPKPGEKRTAEKRIGNSGTALEEERKEQTKAVSKAANNSGTKDPADNTANNPGGSFRESVQQRAQESSFLQQKAKKRPETGAVHEIAVDIVQGQGTWNWILGNVWGFTRLYFEWWLDYGCKIWVDCKKWKHIFHGWRASKSLLTDMHQISNVLKGDDDDYIQISGGSTGGGSTSTKKSKIGQVCCLIACIVCWPWIIIAYLGTYIKRLLNNGAAYKNYLLNKGEGNPYEVLERQIKTGVDGTITKDKMPIADPFFKLFCACPNLESILKALSIPAQVLYLYLEEHTVANGTHFKVNKNLISNLLSAKLPSPTNVDIVPTEWDSEYRSSFHLAARGNKTADDAKVLKAYQKYFSSSCFVLTSALTNSNFKETKSNTTLHRIPPSMKYCCSEKTHRNVGYLALATTYATIFGTICSTMRDNFYWVSDFCFFPITMVYYPAMKSFTENDANDTKNPVWAEFGDTSSTSTLSGEKISEPTIGRRKLCCGSCDTNEYCPNDKYAASYGTASCAVSTVLGCYPIWLFIFVSIGRFYTCMVKIIFQLTIGWWMRCCCYLNPCCYLFLNNLCGGWIKPAQYLGYPGQILTLSPTGKPLDPQLQGYLQQHESRTTDTEVLRKGFMNSVLTQKFKLSAIQFFNFANDNRDVSMANGNPYGQAGSLQDPNNENSNPRTWNPVLKRAVWGKFVEESMIQYGPAIDFRCTSAFLFGNVVDCNVHTDEGFASARKIINILFCKCIFRSIWNVGCCALKDGGDVAEQFPLSSCSGEKRCIPKNASWLSKLFETRGPCTFRCMDDTDTKRRNPFVNACGLIYYAFTLCGVCDEEPVDEPAYTGQQTVYGTVIASENAKCSGNLLKPICSGKCFHGMCFPAFSEEPRFLLEAGYMPDDLQHKIGLKEGKQITMFQDAAAVYGKSGFDDVMAVADRTSASATSLAALNNISQPAVREALVNYLKKIENLGVDIDQHPALSRDVKTMFANLDKDAIAAARRRIERDSGPHSIESAQEQQRERILYEQQQLAKRMGVLSQGGGTYSGGDVDARDLEEARVAEQENNWGDGSGKNYFSLRNLRNMGEVSKQLVAKVTDGINAAKSNTLLNDVGGVLNQFSPKTIINETGEKLTKAQENFKDVANNPENQQNAQRFAEGPMKFIKGSFPAILAAPRNTETSAIAMDKPQVKS